MLALIAGHEDTRSGPVPIALAHAGFEPRAAGSADEAARHIGARGARDCVLVLDAVSLDERATDAAWGELLREHEGVAAVVISRCGECSPRVRAVTRGPHRILLEDPFDAAAIVAAAVRASATARHRARRAVHRFERAG